MLSCISLLWQWIAQSLCSTADIPAPGERKRVPTYLPSLQSWLHGKFLQFFDRPAVELTASRGYETYKSKYLMRWTVVISDILGECICGGRVPAREIGKACYMHVLTYLKLFLQLPGTVRWRAPFCPPPVFRITPACANSPGHPCHSRVAMAVLLGHSLLL